MAGPLKQESEHSRQDKNGVQHAESGGHSIRASSGSLVHPGGEPALPRTVLFVSEDDSFRSTTRAYLEDEGLLVRSCADASRLPTLFFSRPGAGAAYSRGIDLLLIDVDALGAAGLRLAAELTSFEPDLPVIVISTPSAEKGFLTSMQRRGWKFVKKPVSIPELLEKIHGALLNLRGT